MGQAGIHTSYPRALRPKERALVDSVLPLDRPGYRRCRELIDAMVVLGEGRRGAGNLILGYERETPDRESPLATIVAYGVVETTMAEFYVTVRECVARQIDVEIVSSRGEEVPDHFEEKRRWTYSTWQPGSLSPANGRPVREVAIDGTLVLAISKDEKRLWVYDGESGMNFPIPITNFYNELMLHRNIRDPKVALASHLLFAELESYSDHDFRAAFVAYNKLRRKVDIAIHPPLQREKNAGSFLKKWFRKEP